MQRLHLPVHRRNKVASELIHPYRNNPESLPEEVPRRNLSWGQMLRRKEPPAFEHAGSVWRHLCISNNNQCNVLQVIADAAYSMRSPRTTSHARIQYAVYTWTYTFGVKGTAKLIQPVYTCRQFLEIEQCHDLFKSVFSLRGFVQKVPALVYSLLPPLQGPPRLVAVFFLMARQS